MSDNIKRELLWLLPTMLLSMVVLYIISWQTGWELRSGQELEIIAHDQYYLLDFKLIAIYVFTHVLMLVYTARLVISNFKVLKLNLVMLVVYGYVAFVNYTFYGMLHAYSSLFYGILGGAMFMAAFTVAMMVIRLVQKKG
jgi:hypothetical protein